mmetsp:Transcript_2736/g.7583  ORF Transcript_2736/g.7583 Transcript_2736/m.7583 type:complete len:213 (+) Transcript_2736:632-1270(+)
MHEFPFAGNWRLHSHIFACQLVVSVSRRATLRHFVHRARTYLHLHADAARKLYRQVDALVAVGLWSASIILRRCRERPKACDHANCLVTPRKRPILLSSPLTRPGGERPERVGSGGSGGIFIVLEHDAQAEHVVGSSLATQEQLLKETRGRLVPCLNREASTGRQCRPECIVERRSCTPKCTARLWRPDLAPAPDLAECSGKSNGASSFCGS